MVATALVALVATSTAFAISHWIACRHHEHATMLRHGMHEVNWLRRELDLTEPQAKEVGKLEKNLAGRLESLCATHCAERSAVGEELAKSVPDAIQARLHLDRMNTIQAEAERAALDHILQVRALLNSDQGRRYGAMIHDQVCTACPLGKHHQISITK